MNINVNTVNFNEICEGCLSKNRKLDVVIDNELRELYTSILRPLDPINHTLSLCWECIAVIKRIVKYKKQVQNAHRCLISYMLHQTISLPILSRLTTHTDIPVISLTQQSNTHNQDEKRHKRIKETKDTDKDTGTVLSIKINHNYTNKTECSVNETEPVFVKVEEEGNIDFNHELEVEGNEYEGFFLDDDGGTGNIDDKDLKTVLKSSSTPCKVERKKAKQKKSRRKKSVDFNDSDDEPLKKVKEEDTTKPRGRRKRTKNDGVDDTKPAKKRGGKRETPPGVVNSAYVTRSLEQLGLNPGEIEMVVLSWEEVEEERQKALKSETFTRHEYRCENCVVGFNHRFKLANHMAKHDPSSGEFLCTVCKIRCRTQHALTAHRRRHRVRWRCSGARGCGGLWSRAGVAADHRARVHAGGAAGTAGGAARALRCRLCPHTATSLSKLRNHLKNHAERQKCELCGKTFRDKSTLKTHLFIHNGEKEHACPRCGKLFLFKKAMQLHAVTHDQHAYLYCLECDMSFKNQMSFYQHMKYNLKHVDPAKLKHVCVLCDKKFMKASRLEEHNLAIHLKQTPIQCPVEGCGFACSSRPVLRSHARALHRGRRAARDHVCHRCGKAYTNKKTLEGHLRSHTGERPYSCPRCAATFRHHAALYNHTRLVHLRHQATNASSQTASDRPGWVPTDQPTGLPS